MASPLSIQPASSCDRKSVLSDDEKLAKEQIQKMVLRRRNGGVDKAASRAHIISLLKKFPKLAAETYELDAEAYHLESIVVVYTKLASLLESCLEIGN